jgi:hypothetical protein
MNRTPSAQQVTAPQQLLAHIIKYRSHQESSLSDFPHHQGFKYFFLSHGIVTLQSYPLTTQLADA